MHSVKAKKRKSSASEDIADCSKRKNCKQNANSLSSIRQIQRNLPVFRFKDELLMEIRNNQVVIVTGETGCGKSTQIPQYLLQDGFGSKGRICCTQPRRVGVLSLSSRVCEEVGCYVGEDVGYSIRFENCVSANTMIVYMTDGVLLRELQNDSLLRKYSVVMIDEAHERTIQTDSLLGLLKDIANKRDDLRVIVSSATLDVDKFSKFFNGAPIFEIPGKLHRVKISYKGGEESEDVVDAIVKRVLKIHRKQKNGDVLAFLPGQEEIEACCSRLRDKAKKESSEEMLVLPAYSALPRSQLVRIFRRTPPGCRKVVVATNIAETSLTIEGIKFVVDSGLVKQKRYNHLLGIDQLIVTDVSKAQADQRAGRAGRMCTGRCYRLYTEKRYERKFLDSAFPEMQRANLCNIVLQLKSIEIVDIPSFSFIDHPGQQRLLDACKQLQSMSALDEVGALTALGKCMSAFPLDPILSKMLIMSSNRHCAEEMVIIVAMLCVQNVFEQHHSSSRSSVAFKKKQDLNRPQGDHVTLLYVYICWRDSGYDRSWCEENCVRYGTMRQAESIRQQLADIMGKCGLQMESCGTRIVDVQNALSLYYFRRNAARKEPGVGYRTVADDQIVHIHPTSALFDKQPGWVVFHDIMVTTDKFMREVTKVNPSFLKELISV